MYTLVWSSAFTRQAQKFLRRHPELQARFEDALRDLEADPFLPRLHLHSLEGELDGLHAARLTHAYRILLVLRITEHEITLLDIGSHDAVYR